MNFVTIIFLFVKFLVTDAADIKYLSNLETHLQIFEEETSRLKTIYNDYLYNMLYRFGTIIEEQHRYIKNLQKMGQLRQKYNECPNQNVTFANSENINAKTQDSKKEILIEYDNLENKTLIDESKIEQFPSEVESIYKHLHVLESKLLILTNKKLFYSEKLNEKMIA
ncbi:hypothetical protein GVAV_002048 [Gurleya vavrai]